LIEPHRDRSGRVEDVIFGCVDTVGPRRATSPGPAGWPAGLPESVPGVTVDRQCGSSQQAVHFAAQAVLSGTADLVVAGGVQNMSMIPISSAFAMRASWASADPFSGRRAGRPGTATQEISQFRGPR
jgi:acetyl-CoA C-acetyltransferase